MRDLANATARLAAAAVALSSCHDAAPGQANPAGAVASAPGAPASPRVAPPSAPPPSSAPAAAPFVAQRVTGEGHAMGTHLAYAAFTTPALDEDHVRALFDAATAEIVRLENWMTQGEPA